MVANTVSQTFFLICKHTSRIFAKKEKMRKLNFLLLCAFFLAEAESFAAEKPSTFEYTIPIMASSSNGNVNRSTSSVPFIVTYDSDYDSITIMPSPYVQEMQIEIHNITTGEILYDIVHAGNNAQVFQSFGTSGYYELTFNVSDGTIYSGSFYL